jgi:hypothetical protein
VGKDSGAGFCIYLGRGIFLLLMNLKLSMDSSVVSDLAVAIVI